MKVRELLSKALPNMRGLTSEEKDPEEVLTALFGTLLKAPPLVELINLKDNKVDRTYLCPLIVDDWTAGVATTQHLLDRSFRSANVKFVYPPKTLILQLPRYGQQKLFDKILPLEHIEITGLVNNSTQPCHGCGKPAEGMCPECFLCKRVTLSE
uniref:NUC202 domain-containing protein n=1 Tax=Angiostrongylus cantonensis TaxID=6313 RepID=A0A0K0D8J4_ANGCA